MTKNKHMSLHEATDKIMAVLDAERRGTRSSTESTGGRASGPGIGTWVAERLGIPPKLAVAGGQRAYAAMMALQHARDAGDGGLRQQHLAQAQRHIGKLDPERHGRLIQHLQGTVVALGGRGGDTEVAHVTPGEWVIPDRVLSPELCAGLLAAAQANGIDPARLRVGSGRNSVNPETGKMEFLDPPSASPQYHPVQDGPFPRDPRYSLWTGTWTNSQTGILPGLIHNQSPADFQNVPNWGLADRQRGLNGVEDMANAVKAGAQVGGWALPGWLTAIAKKVPTILHGPIEGERQLITDEQRRRLNNNEDNDQDDDR